jgi:hypothetical protein
LAAKRHIKTPRNVGESLIALDVNYFTKAWFNNQAKYVFILANVKLFYSGTPLTVMSADIQK